MQYWSLVDTAKFFDRLWGRVEAEAPHDVAKVGEVKLCRAVEVEDVKRESRFCRKNERFKEIRFRPLIKGCQITF